MKRYAEKRGEKGGDGKRDSGRGRERRKGEMDRAIEREREGGGLKERER